MTYTLLTLGFGLRNGGKDTESTFAGSLFMAWGDHFCLQVCMSVSQASGGTTTTVHRQRPAPQQV